MFKKSFFTLINLILSILIISILGYFILNLYFNRSFKEGKEDNSGGPEKKMEILDYSATVEDAKKTIDRVNKKILEQENHIKNLFDK